MAEGTEERVPVEGPDSNELTPGYKASKKVDLQTLQQMDADDESLVKYKQHLLGDGQAEGSRPNVIVKKMIISPKDRDEIVIDLTGDLSERPLINIKEGTEYQIKIAFIVQQEIVSGLRYHSKAYRKGIRDDEQYFMVGSYGPRTEEYIYKTPVDTAPTGMLSRGTYTNKSMFTDDDKNVILQWEWNLSIKKEWE